MFFGTYKIINHLQKCFDRYFEFPTLEKRVASEALCSIIASIRPEGLPSTEEEMLALSYEEKQQLFSQHKQIIISLREISVQDVIKQQEKLDHLAREYEEKRQKRISQSQVTLLKQITPQITPRPPRSLAVNKSPRNLMASRSRPQVFIPKIKKTQPAPKRPIFMNFMH